jgi:predicted transposase YbfD/YdcC
MPRKAKKLEELGNIFREKEVNGRLFDDVEVMKELKDKLGVITDKRHESYIRHNLIDIIIITLFAVMSNANEWNEIEAFGKVKERWLRRFLELPNGIPSDDTIRIVISSINSNYFYNLVIEFLIEKMNEIINTMGIVNHESEIEEKDIISLDGKTSCGSKRNETNKAGAKALHTLNTYSSDLGMCIGQVFVDEKSNEIPAAIDLLDIIEVKGTIVTWDALNTQKETVKKVIARGGDYVGALKGNQHNFYKDVKDYFEEEVLSEIKTNKINYIKTIEKEHSAIITREYFLSYNIEWLYDKNKWKGLESIGYERKTIERLNGKTSMEERYFISSVSNIKDFSRAIRDHWGVENGLHWQLDFTFKDDKNTTMDKNGARNLQLIKKAALSILKISQSIYKVSLKMIRYKLSLNFDGEIEKIFGMLNTKDLRIFLK